MKTIYIFDESGVYTGNAEVEDADVFNPTIATDIPPPESENNKSACFKDGVWSLLEDYRHAELYNKETATVINDVKLGDSPESLNATTIKPIDSSYVWIDNKWELPLDKVKEAKLKLVKQEYNDSIIESISFETEAGVVKKFQADIDSQDVLLKVTIGYGFLKQVPNGFYWKSEDNTLVTFTYKDLCNLYTELLNRGNINFIKMQTLKAKISKALTKEEVELITW